VTGGRKKRDRLRPFSSTVTGHHRVVLRMGGLGSAAADKGATVGSKEIAMKALLVTAALALCVPVSGSALAASPPRSCKALVRHAPECEVRSVAALVPAGALQVVQDTYG
jgi:hypothetical protein